MERMKLRNTILYYLLSSIRELGISLPLIFRRVTEIASKDIDYLSTEFFQGKIRTDNIKNMVEDLAQMLKNEQLVEDIKTEITDNEIIIEVKNCNYLELAKKAQKQGEKTCPICLIALAASIATTVVKDVSFNFSEYETDLDAGICRLKISYEGV